MSEKTHYRKAFKSPYLSSSDIVGEITLTVVRVGFEKDLTKRTSESFNTIHFKEREIRRGEKMKPMILNVGNTEILRALAGGSKYLEDWQLNIPISIYVQPGVKFGRDTVDGLRIKPEVAIISKQLITPETVTLWNNAKAAYKRDGNLSAVLERCDMTEEHQAKLKEECDA